MKAHASVAAENRDGRTVLSNLRSDPPISLRPTSSGVAVVGSAAGPVGGDEVALAVDVGAGATLRIEPIAATMVFPGRECEPSLQLLTITVGAAGHLQWCGQPLLSIVGSNHVQRVHIELGAGATLDYLDWIVLGRSGEGGGYLDTELRIVREGGVILHQRQIYDPAEPGWRTSAGLGGFDQVKQQVRVGPRAGPTRVETSDRAIEVCSPVCDDVELQVSLS